MTPLSFLVGIPSKVEVHLVKTHQGRLRRIVFDNQRYQKGIKNNGENNFCYSHRLTHLFGYQSVNPLTLLLVKEILRPYYSLIATNIYLAIPSGQYSGSLWLIEQCRNAFFADLKMPLNLLLFFLADENNKN